MDDHQLTDEQLIHEYGQGNAQALETIFGRYKNPVFNFCLRILHNRADAEDATGEVFMTLCSNRYVEQPGAKFSTWLFTLARNNCLSRIRQSKKFLPFWFKNPQTDELQPMEIPDNSPLPNRQLEEKETADQIKEALKRLPLEQKEALILREYHQMPYEQVAQVLNCSLSKVKVLIFRARETLRCQLPLSKGGEVL